MLVFFKYQFPCATVGVEDFAYAYFNYNYAILVVAVVPLISEKKGKVVGLDLINSFDFENPKSFKFNTV